MRSAVADAHTREFFFAAAVVEGLTRKPQPIGREAQRGYCGAVLLQRGSVRHEEGAAASLHACACSRILSSRRTDTRQTDKTRKPVPSQTFSPMTILSPRATASVPCCRPHRSMHTAPTFVGSQCAAPPRSDAARRLGRSTRISCSLTATPLRESALTIGRQDSAGLCAAEYRSSMVMMVMVMHTAERSSHTHCGLRMQAEG